MQFKVIIEDEKIDKYIQEAVHDELNKMGLLRFIKEEVFRVFHNWQRDHSSMTTQLRTLNSKVGAIEKKLKGVKDE